MAKHKDLRDMKSPTGKDIESFLAHEGWELESQNGSHRKWTYHGAEVIVAGHGNQPISKGTWCAMRRAILAAMGMAIIALLTIIPYLYI